MIEQLLERYSLHGNWVDLMFLLLLGYFLITQKGFISTILESLAFLFSLIVSYKTYAFFGKLLVLNFSIPNGIANASGFFIAWFLAELFFSVLVLQYLGKFLVRFEKKPLNISLGFIASFIQTTLVFLFFVSFIFAFPINGQIKQAILDSRLGPFFVNLSRNFEKDLKNIFGGAINETLNFLTVKPQSNERLDLGFKAQKKLLTYDLQSEMIMFDLVNQERVQYGVKKLIFDDKLRDVSRSYAREMFINGFFSHISAVDGSAPADRASLAGISFLLIGENLAYAPDVYVAHQGLMNSEGHRKNILSGEFSRVGIGVVDGGVWGKMFVQEFAD